MNDPIGLATFPGVNQIVGATFSYSAHGITPSICSLEIAPQESFITRLGDLTLLFGNQRQVFPDCLVDTASFQWDTRGQLWSFKILDRRWKWKWGKISGSYNIRQPDGTSIYQETEADPIFLATLCLEEMGEVGYDTTALPLDPRITIDWNEVVPADALADLCDQLGYRVVLQLNNRVKICKLGEGEQLPTDNLESNSLAVAVTTGPDKIGIITAPIQYQVDLELEAVGVETDGTIVPIDELSYTPEGGWATAFPWGSEPFPQLYVNDGTVIDIHIWQKLAESCIYKWYRPKLPIALPGTDNQVTSHWQMTLVNKLNDYWLDAFNVQQYRDAFVYGIYWTVLMTSLYAREGVTWPVPTGVYGNNATRIDPLDAEKYEFRSSFSIDQTTMYGPIIKLSEACFKATGLQEGFDEAKTASMWAEPNLVLRCVLIYNDLDTRAPLRYTRERQRNQSGNTNTRYSKHDEIVPTINAYYFSFSEEKGLSVPHKGLDNSDNVDTACEAYLDALEKEYQTMYPQTVNYAGLRFDIEVDGSIQHIIWSIRGAARTTVTKDTEHYAWVDPYVYRRLLNHTRGMAEWWQTPMGGNMGGKATMAEAARLRALGLVQVNK